MSGQSFDLEAGLPTLIVKEIVMKVAIGGDSAGVGLARVLADYLKDRFDVFEVSSNESNSNEFCANLS